MSGLAQLVAIGPQDVHLTENPNVTFFESIYKRHTNFATFMKKQVITGNPQAGGLSSIKIERYGDLLNYIFLVATKNDETQLISDWSSVIESAELVIGGSIVDIQDSIFSEEIAVDTFATNGSRSFPASLHGGQGSPSFFYPFRFFFCEAWASALPLVAMQYHEVEIRIRWAANLDPAYTMEFGGRFTVLDEDERRSMAQRPEYDMIIYQVQKSVPSGDKKQQLSFNHPVKFIASSNFADDNALVSRTNKLMVQIDGNEIAEHMFSVPYYTSIPAYYHTAHSSSNSENIFIMPFCLETSRYQPTGTLNFSRITTFEIHCTQPITKPVYAVNYNVLRIKNGMAGVLYSN
jgi:hypothetical protein